MKSRYTRGIISGLVILFIAACAPKATSTPVDTVGTPAAELVSGMLTQTAAAASPASLPLLTTITPTVPNTTEAGTSTQKPVVHKAYTNKKAACYYGPGSSYPLEGKITGTKRVNIIGRGSVSGWYIINDPDFHIPCWISTADLNIDPAEDLSVLPIMTPGQ